MPYILPPLRLSSLTLIGISATAGLSSLLDIQLQWWVALVVAKFVACDAALVDASRRSFRAGKILLSSTCALIAGVTSAMLASLHALALAAGYRPLLLFTDGQGCSLGLVARFTGLDCETAILAILFVSGLSLQCLQFLWLLVPNARPSSFQNEHRSPPKLADEPVDASGVRINSVTTMKRSSPDQVRVWTLRMPQDDATGLDVFTGNFRSVSTRTTVMSTNSARQLICMRSAAAFRARGPPATQT